MQALIHGVLILGRGLAGLRAAVELSIRTHGGAGIGIVSKVQIMRALPLRGEIAGAPQGVFRCHYGG